jgi:pyrroloquinoline quinone (PQQ) biosynthesis protein C
MSSSRFPTESPGTAAATQPGDRLPVIRTATSHADRERIYRFRYQVYVEEMRRLQKYADHTARRIEEPFDLTGHLLIAESGPDVVGTLRTNRASLTSFGYYIDLFQLHSLGAAWPNHVTLTTKLMVAPSHRCGRLAIRLAREMYRFGREHGVRVDIIDCNAHLRGFFARLGYRPYMGTAIHPEYGEVLPMRLDLEDIAYLRSLQSPLAPSRTFQVGLPDPEQTSTPFPNPSTQPEIPNTTMQDPQTPTPTQQQPGSLVAWLDQRVSEVIHDIETCEFWQVMNAPDSDPELVREAMKEVYLEIFSYQAHAIEGAINAIAKLPRSMPIRMIKAMLRHQAEEFDHGEMALRDYVRLGGSESYARDHHRISPASYATASIWRTIGLLDEPFAYLGALYPFEGITPIVSARIKEVLVRRGIPNAAMEFVEFHSTEDPKHAELIRHLIEEVGQRYPEADLSIREGIERFLAVYPIPVWETAYRRAQANLARAKAA